MPEEREGRRAAEGNAEAREPSECLGLRGGLCCPRVPVSWAGGVCGRGETCSSGQRPEASGRPPEREKSGQARTGIALGAGL